MSTNIRPLHDRIVVKRLDVEQQTKGGILLPDNAAEKPSQGIVIAVGPGRTLDNGDVRALDVKVNDKILFGKYAGTEVKIDGEEIIVMKEDDVFGVIEG